MTTTRNSSCPCGSGKKYKKCCLERDRAAEVALPWSQLETEAVLDGLFAYAEREEFADLVAESMVRFSSGGTPEDVADTMEFPECRVGFWLWVTLDLPGPDGATIADRYRKKEAERFTRGERRYLDALCRTELGIYEVLVVSDMGAMLRDVFANEPLYAKVNLKAAGLQRWAVIAARLVRDEGMLEVLEPFYVFSPLDLHDILEAAKTSDKETKRLLRENGREVEPDVAHALTRSAFASIVNMICLAGILEEQDSESAEQLPLLEELCGAPDSASERREHMLDTPIPFLKNQTLRAASRRKNYRARAVSLLKAIEQAEKARRDTGEEAVDTATLWDELGFSPNA